MLAWSLRAFAAAGSIDAVVVAAPPGHEDEVRALVEAESQNPATKVVTGGETRSESVANALAALGEVGDPPDGLVAIHDAARPLVTPELIDRTVAALGQDAGAAGVIAAERVADTLKKEAAAGVIAATVSRDGLWAAQTPQVFRIAALRDVVGEEAAAVATDEAMLIEREGWTVLLQRDRAAEPEGDDAGGPGARGADPARARAEELQNQHRREAFGPRRNLLNGSGGHSPQKRSADSRRPVFSSAGRFVPLWGHQTSNRFRRRSRKLSGGPNLPLRCCRCSSSLVSRRLSRVAQGYSPSNPPRRRRCPQRCSIPRSRRPSPP